MNFNLIIQFYFWSITRISVPMALVPQHTQKSETSGYTWNLFNIAYLCAILYDFVQFPQMSKSVSVNSTAKGIVKKFISKIYTVKIRITAILMLLYSSSEKLITLLLLKHLFIYTRVGLNISMYTTYVQVRAETRRRHWIPWS